MKSILYCPDIPGHRDCTGSWLIYNKTSLNKIEFFLSWYLLQMTSWLELRLCAHFLLIMLVRCMVEIVHVFWIFHSLCGLVGLSVLFSLEVVSLGSCDTTAIYNISVSSYARFWSLNERWLINTYYLGLGVSKFLPCCILCICVSLCCYQGKLQTQDVAIPPLVIYPKEMTLYCMIISYSQICNCFYWMLTCSGRVVELGHI